jgi:hypothetical protein
MEHAPGGAGDDQPHEHSKQLPDIPVSRHGQSGTEPTAGPAQDIGAAKQPDARAPAKTQQKEPASWMRRLTEGGLLGLLLTIVATSAEVRQVSNWMWVIIFEVVVLGIIVLRIAGKPLRSWITLLTAVIVALGIGVVVLVFTRPIPIHQLLAPHPTTTNPSPGPTTTSPSPTASGESPPDMRNAISCPVSGEFPVEVRSVASQDGKPGINSDLVVEVMIKNAAEDNHTYWLFSKVTNLNGKFVHVAKARISDSVGQDYSRIHLFNAAKGSKRRLLVVEGNKKAAAWLKKNNDTDGDATWDTQRLELPPGVRIISNACKVKKTR